MKITSLFILLFLVAIACGSDPGSYHNCSEVPGANFSKSGGQIQQIIEYKCSGSECHTPGGWGTLHWTIGDYNQMKPHFSSMTVAVASGAEPQGPLSPLNSAELTLFDCWAQSGFPE